MSRLRFWNEFCHDHRILSKGVPLFEINEVNVVNTLSYGSKRRYMLKRSALMEHLVINEVEKVIKDYEFGSNVYDGLVYMAYWKENTEVIPVYIGKSEKYGKNNGNLSENIKAIRSNVGKFCRWGYNYQYHVGDLSAVVCPDHEPTKVQHKYEKWARLLFEEFPTMNPVLRKPLFFWIMAWNSQNVGLWKEFGPTSLTFLEYQMIGVASSLFPEVLLNDEGVNRPPH